MQILANLKEERNEINAKWQSEKSVVDAIQQLKTDIENYKARSRKSRASRRLW